MFVSSFPPLTSPSVSQSLLLVSFYFKLNPFLENSQGTRQSISKISQFNKEVTRSQCPKETLSFKCVCEHTHNARTCMSIGICMGIQWCLQRPEEGVRHSETKVTGGCESPDVSAGTQTLVPWKGSKHS